MSDYYIERSNNMPSPNVVIDSVIQYELSLNTF